MKQTRDNRRERCEGFAFASSMLIVILLAGISVGMMYLVNTEGRLRATDLEQTQSFYGAEAAMEKMMSDLNALYASHIAPSVADIEGLSDASYRPTLTDISYREYEFTVPNVDGAPITEVRNITSGPNEGLMAYIIPMTLGVAARGPRGSEVKMEREIEVALIPVFQFGIFSDSDLSYFPGPGFDFGGRVHTNGSLFLATSSGSGLTFHSKITAVNEVIRAELANGLGTVATGRDEPVLIPTSPGGCDGAQPACRDLQENEGSKTGGPSSADNTNWPNISLTSYNGTILNGDTGAKRLDLPFVAPGLRPIEIIRRPRAGEDPTSLVAQSRLYTIAQIRVLISDDASEHPGGAGVRLANVAPYYTGLLGLLGGTYGATDTAFAEGRVSWDSHFRQPPGAPTQWPLIDGYLLVQSRRADGTYVNVTQEWLNLGIARENPDAILKFQQLKDNNGDGNPDYGASDLDEPSRVLPLGLYDTREGEVRDQDLGGSTSCAIGGIMNIVEVDVGNLKRWLQGNIGTTGTLTESASQNGYVFYYSDRRGMLGDPDVGAKTGEYGFEDMINPPASSGAPDDAYHAAEDVNENGELETYGAGNLGDAFGVANGDPTIRIDCNTIGRKNRVSGARHGLKVVNGSLGNVPVPGFTVASENMVYVMGNFNANDAGFGEPHSATGVIADGVTFLSKSWQDWRSFRWPTDNESRVASTSHYRIAVAAGKNKNWPHPGWAASEEYGLDGGTHNFLRYLERWSGEQFWYRGSLVSLYYSEYANGIYKCCDGVYSAPEREYSFDTDFLDVATLPPGTPRFRDLVNLGFRQILTPE